jgi:hypothetical protein
LSKDKLFASFVLLLIGIFFLVFGILMFRLAPQSFIRQADRVAEFTPVVATVLRDTRPGREVLIEGRISDRNPLKSYSFVAYDIYDREVDSDGDETWAWRTSVTPPLWLELADGLVQIEEGYYLAGTETSTREGNTRYNGLKVGDPVIALGILASRVDPPRITAEFIAFGTQADYIASQRRAASAGRIFGIVFATIGGGLLIVGLVIAVRRSA